MLKLSGSFLTKYNLGIIQTFHFPHVPTNTIFPRLERQVVLITDWLQEVLYSRAHCDRGRGVLNSNPLLSVNSVVVFPSNLTPRAPQHKIQFTSPQTLLHLTSIFAPLHLILCCICCTRPQIHLGSVHAPSRGRILTEGRARSNRGRIQLSWTRGICSLVFEGAM